MKAKISDLYDLSHTIAAPLLERFEYPWEALPYIKEFILELGATLPEDEFDHPAEGVWIAKDATVFDSAYIGSTLIIDHGAEVRQCAFLRCPAIVGKGAVVGNSSELKNVVLFDKVQVPHFNYVGDSILGYCAHTGAGAITSNLKSDKSRYAGRSCGSGLQFCVEPWLCGGPQQQCVSAELCARLCACQ